MAEMMLPSYSSLQGEPIESESLRAASLLKELRSASALAGASCEGDQRDDEHILVLYVHGIIHGAHDRQLGW